MCVANLVLRKRRAAKQRALDSGPVKMKIGFSAGHVEDDDGDDAGNFQNADDEEGPLVVGADGVTDATPDERAAATRSAAAGFTAASFHVVRGRSPSPASPPRRRAARHDSDDDGDASPPLRRAARHDSDDGDASPPRRRAAAAAGGDDSDASPPRARPAEGAGARRAVVAAAVVAVGGLQSAAVVKADNDRRVEATQRAFSALGDSAAGRGAATGVSAWRAVLV